jgi:hypothetical protein
MKTLMFALLLLAGGTRALTGDPHGGDQPQPAEDAALVARVCSGCHALSVVTSARHTPDAWSEVVDRMASYGLDASDADLARIKAYLAKAQASPSPGGA